VIGPAATGAGTLRDVLSPLLAQIGGTDCEVLGTGDLAQPVNAITSFAYVAVGLIIAVLAVRSRGPRWESLLFALLLVAVGLGSVAFHGPQPDGARLMHDLPILLTALFMLVHDLRVLWPAASWSVFPIAAIAATALAVASADAGVAATGIVLVAVAVAEIVIYRRRLRPQNLLQQRRADIAIIIVVAAGAASWLLGRTDSPACDPDSVFQLHGLWHALSATAFGIWWWRAIGSRPTQVQSDDVPDRVAS
jgi:hypothetical protein